MPSIAFALPVAAGKEGQHVRKFIDVLLDEKSSHFRERMHDRGYQRFQIFHQNWPVEQFVIYAEADDVHATMKGKEDGSEFDAWLRSEFASLTGHELSKLKGHISELIMDWHHEKGGARTHHR